MLLCDISNKLRPEPVIASLCSSPLIWNFSFDMRLEYTVEQAHHEVDAQYVPLAGWKINEFPQHESPKCRLDVPGHLSCLMQQEHSKK